MHLSRLRALVAVFVFAVTLGLAAPSAHAVDINGRIKGTVSDPSGAVLAGVPVIATNTATGVKFTTTTQATGDYLFPQLPVGTYSITVSAPGFNNFTAVGITVNIDQEYVETVKLEIGNNQETLEVAADAVQVNTTDMQINNIVDAKQMVELPLINRNFTGLELIEPGVQASSDRFGTYSTNGAQTQQSEYLINGADTNDLALNTLVIAPNLDAIAQFNLIEGPLNAEYDRNSGGIVTATIKQGTNHFHGDAFEFYRDTFLNTGNFFSYIAATPTKAAYKNVTPYHQNIFGGTLGGPIFKDKVFFFGAYQGTRQRVPGTGGNATVLSSAQRGGDFSADIAGSSLGYKFTSNPIPGTLKIGSCPGATTWAQCVAINKGIFAPGDFSSVSSGLLSKYVPVPNSGTNSYVFNSVNTTANDQYIGRLDYALNPKNQFTFLMIYQKQALNSVIPFTGATLPGFPEIDTQHTQQYTFDYVRQLSNTLVNDFAVHYTRFNYGAVYPVNTLSPSSAGFSITPEITAAQSLPTIATGYFTLGFSTNGPQPRIDQVYQADDNISKTFGHHSLKFGYDGRKFEVSNPFGARNSGSYGFSAGGSYSTGDPGLDFLLGNSNSYSQGSGAIIQANAFLNYFYGQDTWKLTDSFTLSYGLGYQVDTPLHNRQYGGEAVVCFLPGQQSTTFPTAPLGFNYPGDKGCSDSALAYTRYNELGPRVGFAWAPDLGWLSAGSSKKFAIRAGYGIYYNRSEEETSLNNLQTPPFGLNTTGAVDYGALAPAFGNPFQDINTGTVYANKFPYSFPTPGQAVSFAVYEPMSISTYSSNFRSPYAENFQLTVERELPSRLVARVSYVGSLARHNQIAYEGNPITQAGHDACLADNTNANGHCGAPGFSGYRSAQARFFPTHTAFGFTDQATSKTAFTSVGLVGSEGSSNYNALQVSLQKAQSHGLQFQLSYTYGHSMDDGSSYENSGYGGTNGRGYNQFNKSLNYGDSTFDARNRLVISPLYVVPFKHSGRVFSPLNLALGGWQISGIVTLAQGFPYDISYGGGSANSLWCSNSNVFYACPDEPNITGPLTRANPRVKLANGRTQWFLPTNVSQAPLGQFGNAHRNPYHGPGINNTNLILAKNFNLGGDGTRSLQLRMESDNVFNHTQFSNPASSFSTSTTGETLTNPGTLSVGSAGQISTAAAARQTQLAAKFYF